MLRVGCLLLTELSIVNALSVSSICRMGCLGFEVHSRVGIAVGSVCVGHLLKSVWRRGSIVLCAAVSTGRQISTVVNQRVMK